MVVKEPQNILAWEPESAAALRYFESKAWCGGLLRRPELRLFRIQYRGRQPRGWDTVVHGLFAEPPGPDAGVLHFLSGMMVSTTGATTAPTLDDGAAGGPAFYALGPGLAGHPRTVHGGVLALLVDSAFAQLGFVHGRPGTRFYSAYTNTHFVWPVVLPDADAAAAEDGEGRRDGAPLPGVDVIVRAQVDSRRTREGDRKIFILARVEGENGVVFVTGESLLVEKVLAGAQKL